MKLPSLLVVVAAVLFHCLGTTSSNCPSNSFCQCSPETVICKSVGQRQNLTIGLLINLKDLQVLEVRGFDVVSLSSHMLRSRSQRSALFTDINTLNIPILALGTSNLQRLEISDVANLKVQPFGIYQVNTSTIILRNVTSRILQQNSIQGRNISEIIFDSCRFDQLQSLSVKFENLSALTLTGTKIEIIQSRAFVVWGRDSTSSVKFHNTSFAQVGENSFRFHDFSKVTFDNCSFGALNTSFIIPDKVKKFEFLQNDFEYSPAGVFDNLSTALINFTGNFFRQIDNGSLTSLSSDQIFENNTFDCNCNLAWLWQIYENRDILERNFCHYPDGLVSKNKLSSFTPVPYPDHDDLCFDVEPISEALPAVTAVIYDNNDSTWNFTTENLTEIPEYHIAQGSNNTASYKLITAHWCFTVALILYFL